MTDMPPNVVRLPRAYRRPPPPPDVAMGHVFDDEFNAGWDEGELPKHDPASPVHLVYLVGAGWIRQPG